MFIGLRSSCSVIGWIVVGLRSSYSTIGWTVVGRGCINTGGIREEVAVKVVAEVVDCGKSTKGCC